MRRKKGEHPFPLTGDDCVIFVGLVATLDENKYTETDVKSLILRCKAAMLHERILFRPEE
jgi:hypothetical protein